MTKKLPGSQHKSSLLNVEHCPFYKMKLGWVVDKTGRNSLSLFFNFIQIPFLSITPGNNDSHLTFSELVVGCGFRSL